METYRFFRIPGRAVAITMAVILMSGCGDDDNGPDDEQTGTVLQGTVIEFQAQIVPGGFALAAGFGMAIAAAGCGLAQSRAIASALEGIARNPSAAGAIRGSMIFGLVLIESLAIYALLIAILLIFRFAPAL